MTLKTIARLAGMLLLGAGLAGCVDVTAELEITSETTGIATTTMTMGAEFYPMIKEMAAAGGEEGAASADAFCQEEGDELTENADGSATCVSMKEGDLAEITAEDDGPNKDTTFEVVSPGVLRVAFDTSDMSGQVTEGQDEQTAAMMKAYFEGHSATIRIKGKKIVETNMQIADDGAAEMVIPFTALFDGSADLPDELYAVVDTN